MPMKVINIDDSFAKFSDLFTPKIVSELNGQHVKVAHLEGDKVPWHIHDNEDELFWVIKGSMDMELPDTTIVLDEGEYIIVPRGVEHRPVAKEECWVILFEPATTLNTGNVEDQKTLHELDHI